MSGGFDPFIGRFQRRRSISTLVAAGQTELCSSINENLDRLAIGDIFEDNCSAPESKSDLSSRSPPGSLNASSGDLSQSAVRSGHTVSHSLAYNFRPSSLVSHEVFAFCKGSETPSNIWVTRVGQLEHGVIGEGDHRLFVG